MRFHYQKAKNKFHKPITLIERIYTPMLTFKNTPPIPVKKTVNAVIVVDRSSSMSHLKRNIVESINAQLQKLREESQKFGYTTNVSIMTFADDVRNDLPITNINQVGMLDENSLVTYGNTALYDAIGFARRNVAPVAYNENNLGMIIVITDGEENHSKHYSIPRLKEELTGLNSQFITLAACGPDSYNFRRLSELGIPAGNMTTWEQTSTGVVRMTRSVTRGIGETYSSYNAGSTTVANFFAPDLNVAPTLVQTNLDDVTNQFDVHRVTSPVPIAQFVQNNTNRPYRVGSCFYPLVKTVTVQNHKDMVLRKKSDGKLYTGDSIRSLLRIPEGGTIELNPTSSPDYDLFIKSTSHNRKLLAGTDLLVRKV